MVVFLYVFFFKQKTAYEMRISDWSSDVCSSDLLLIRLLRELGVSAAAYIPDRLMEGYGPSGEALVRLAQGGSTLIVTVDCGAQAFDALDMARAAGVDVIVVDHHKCAAALPVAHALVRSEEHTSELQSLMRISYAVFCLK